MDPLSELFEPIFFAVCLSTIDIIDYQFEHRSGWLEDYLGSDRREIDFF